MLGFILLALVVVAPVTNALWKPVKISSSASRSVIVYDYDGDGKPDIVTNTGVFFLLKGATSVFPGNPQIGLSDIDGDGTLELVVYYPSLGQIVVNKDGRITTMEAPGNSTARFYEQGVIIGDTVIIADRSYNLPKGYDAYFPVHSKSTDLVVATVNDTVDIISPPLEKPITRIPVSNPKLMYAYMEDWYVYIFVSAGNDTVLIVYNTLGKTARFIPIPGHYTMYAHISQGKFLLAGPGNAIIAGLGGYWPAGTPVEGLELIAPSGVAIYDGARLGVVNYTDNTLHLEDTVEVPMKPASFSYYKGVWAVVFENDTGPRYYVKSPKPVNFTVSITTPVYTGDNITIRVSGNYSVARAVYQGLAKESENGTITFKAIGLGKQQVIVTVCTYSACTQKTYWVYVMPREMNVVINAPSTAKAYQYITINISVIDVLSHQPVKGATCLVTPFHGESMIARPFKPVKVMVTPAGTEFTVKVRCTANGYAPGLASKRIMVPPNYYELKPYYQGSGRLTLIVYDKYRGKPAPNLTLTVVIDGKEKFNGSNPITITVKPGKHQGVLTAYYGGIIPVFKTTFNFTYYADFAKIPAGTCVNVADRIINMTKCNCPTPTPPPPRVKIVKEKETNLLLIGSAFMSGLGIAFLVGFIAWGRKHEWVQVES